MAFFKRLLSSSPWSSHFKMSFLQDGTDFYLKEYNHMVAVPPPCPPTLEKPIGCTLTISQLESLYQQLFIVAPTGTYWRGQVMMWLGLLILYQVTDLSIHPFLLLSNFQASCPVQSSPICWGILFMLTWVETFFLNPGSTALKLRYSQIIPKTQNPNNIFFCLLHWIKLYNVAAW